MSSVAKSTTSIVTKTIIVQHPSLVRLNLILNEKVQQCRTDFHHPIPAAHRGTQAIYLYGSWGNRVPVPGQRPPALS